MILILAIALSILIHLFVGWEYTILAGVFAGYFGKKFGPIQGMAALGIAWMSLLFWNFIVAKDPASKLVDFFSHLLGDLSPGLVLILIIGIACILGLLGGLIGQQIRMLFNKPKVQQI